MVKIRNLQQQQDTNENSATLHAICTNNDGDDDGADHDCIAIAYPGNGTNKSLEGAPPPPPAVDLKDVIIFMEFEYNGQYGTRHYLGVGEMNHNDQIIHVNMPNKFGNMCEVKRYKWWKEAFSICERQTEMNKKQRCDDDGGLRGYSYGFGYGGYFEQQQQWNCDDDSEDEADFDYWENKSDDLVWTPSAEEISSFPTAHIFVILPPHGFDSSKTFHVVKNYSGKPKWKQAYGVEDDWHGPEICEEDLIAHLFDNKYLCHGHDSLVVVHQCPHGAYSQDQAEELKRYDDVDPEDDVTLAQLRKKDVMEFVLGPIKQK